MRRIRYAYLLIIAILSGLWLVADPVFSVEYEFYAFRESMLNFTGIVAIGTMSVALILAVRWAPVEPLLGGLDKSYRLHKWMGITGLAFSVFHFLLANVPKIMVGAGYLEEPAATPVAEPSSAILQFFLNQYALAEEFGDWGFKIALVLILISLIKRFPYRFFFRSHRLLSAVFLVLAFHSLVLMDFSYWEHIAGPVMAILVAVGMLAALQSLFGLVGFGHRAVGEIERLEFHEQNSVLKIGIRLLGKWAGHEEGQFAFVTFDRREGAHPFTIASPWTGDGTVAFFVKGLGDYTRTLPGRLKKGDLVTVEGPYGCFRFETEKPMQIWVAGGIGIAPFVARIKALMKHPADKTVDFFYCAGEADDESFINRVRSASEQAHVRSHILIPGEDGRLDADRICREVPEWKNADFWFCGPVAFGQSLRKQLMAKGLAAEDFHQELFNMR
jgi:predicted ferric reductase